LNKLVSGSDAGAIGSAAACVWMLIGAFAAAYPTSAIIFV
jgi:hypothetical protein